MLNQVVLVGRLTRGIEVKENEKGEKYAILSVVVPRSFKNENGEYDKDFIDCLAKGLVAINTGDYCNRGDIIGIKGRLESNDETENKIVLVAEKVTFLSSRKNNEE